MEDFSSLVELFVYPVISLLVISAALPLVRPLIVSRNKVLCSALGILVGAASGVVTLFGGATFLYGIGDMGWPTGLFYFFYYLWMVAIPAVPVLTGWLTYRIARGVDIFTSRDCTLS